MDYTIRFAKKEDSSQIIALCKAHATYEKVSYGIDNKEKHLIKHLFGKEKALTCLVVEANKELIGYATFMKQYATWDAAFYIYLDCLYLKESTRSKGIGLALINQVKEYATAQNCSIIQWQTPTFNTAAIKFYNKLGASSKQKERFTWQIYRISILFLLDLFEFTGITFYHSFQ